MTPVAPSESSVPAKLLLFGEWAVLKGHTAVGVPLRSFFHLRATPALTTTLHTTNSDWEHSADLLQNDSWCQRVFQTLQTKLPLGASFRFDLQREWPLTQGLGSSSALFLCLVEFAEATRAQKLDWPELKTLFSLIPQNQGSGVDLAIQRLRQPIAYQSFAPTPLANFRWPSSLVLLHGHRKTKTCEAIQKKSPTPAAIATIAQSAQKFARSDFAESDWLNALHAHYDALREIEVIPPEALALQEHLARDAKILGLKSVGAGGTDGLLVWTSAPEQLSKYDAPLRELGWYRSPHEIYRHD